MKREEDLSRIKGIGESSVEYFHEEDFYYIRDLEDATLEDVMEVKYMREDRAKQILESVERQLEKRRNRDLFYDPIDEEYKEEEPENFTCECNKSFPQKSVFLAHSNICNEI